MKDDYFESDDFREILNNYEESRRNGYPSYLDEDDYADLSDFYMNNNKPMDAMTCAEEGLSNHPDSVLLQSVKSGLLIFYHRYQEARDLLNTIPQERSNLDVFYQRAQLIYALDGDADTAEELFREWIELQKKEEKKNNENDDEYIRESFIHVITSFVELTENRQYDEELVKRWVEEYLVTFPNIGRSSSDTVLSEIVREEHLYDMVEKVYLKILENDPYNNMGYTILATAQNALGKIEESIESCNFALAIDSRDWEAKAVLAHNHFVRGNHEEALRLIEEVSNELGDNSQSLLYSKCLILSDRIEEGYQQLKNAVEYAQQFRNTIPDFYTELFCEIADIYLMCEHDDEALAAIDKVLEIIPDDPHYLIEKGIILAHNDRDPELADVYIRESIEIAEDKIDAALGAAVRLLFTNSLDKALIYLDEAESYDAKYQDDKYRKSVIPAYRSLIYYKKKLLEEFLTSLHEACEVCPDMVGNLFADQIPSNIPPEHFFDYLMSKVNDILKNKENNKD